MLQFSVIAYLKKKNHVYRKRKKKRKPQISHAFQNLLYIPVHESMYTKHYVTGTRKGKGPWKSNGKVLRAGINVRASLNQNLPQYCGQ